CDCVLDDLSDRGMLDQVLAAGSDGDGMIETIAAECLPASKSNSRKSARTFPSGNCVKSRRSRSCGDSVVAENAPQRFQEKRAHFSVRKLRQIKEKARLR